MEKTLTSIRFFPSSISLINFRDENILNIFLKVTIHFPKYKTVATFLRFFLHSKEKKKKKKENFSASIIARAC